MPQTYLITGASSGLGLAISLAALRAGNKVLGTSRNPTTASLSTPSFAAAGGIWLQLDVTDPSTESTIASAISTHNVDVLINNAGYAIRGALEDLSTAQITSQFNTNFFGALSCTRAAIPHFRKQRKGSIVMISSTSGMIPDAGSSMYAASKAALESTAEALSYELAPFNIRVLIVQPGAFRTNFQAMVDIRPVSAAYIGTPAEEMTRLFSAGHGKQPGDPELAGAAIVEVIDGTGRGANENVKRCLRLPLGKDASLMAAEMVERFERDVAATRHITEAMSYE